MTSKSSSLAPRTSQGSSSSSSQNTSITPSASWRQSAAIKAQAKYGGLELNQYSITSKVLGVGSFGAAMVCYQKNQKNQPNQRRTIQTDLVIKIADFGASKHKCASKIFIRELNVYQELHKHSHVKPYLIKVFSQGKFKDRNQDECYAMVMEYGGLNLEQYMQHHGWYAIPMYHLCELACQMTQGLQAFHEARFIHRDIKPGNITILNNQIKLIDLGLAQLYTPTKQPSRIRKCIGTPRFCAAKQHSGFPGSPACDLEAMFYTIIYLLGETLPWHGYKCTDVKLRIRRIGKIKLESPSKQLCRNLPQGAGLLLSEIRRLRYADIPEYRKIHMYFKTASQPTHSNKPQKPQNTQKTQKTSIWNPSNTQRVEKYKIVERREGPKKEEEAQKKVKISNYPKPI
jgi:serine/threonine protein kinase